MIGASTCTGGKLAEDTEALTLSAFADPHVHLDEALTSELVPNPRGDLEGGR